MTRTVVAVGSKRSPKLQAVAEAFKIFGHVLDPIAEFEIEGFDVASGVGHTPLGRQELMAGARGRVEALVKLASENGNRWGFYVGLEGGLDIVPEAGRRNVFLESWAYVSDSTGRGAYGHSGGILLPERLAEEVVDRGTELSAAIDAYAGGHLITV